LKRRGFLQALFALPAAPAVAALPVAVEVESIGGTWLEQEAAHFGAREDLTDLIYDIYPMQKPFISRVGK